MAHVIDSRGVDLGDITNPDLLTYYRREPGFTVGGVTTPANPARSSADILPVWAANTVYVVGQEILDPTGVTILVRQSTGTSRSTYDSTEQALWSAAGAGGGGVSLPSQTGNAGKYLTTDGSSASWGTVAGGSALPSNFVAKSSAYTAVANDWVEATTTAGFTVTLPTSSAVGAQVAVQKVSADTNVLTIAAAGGGSIDGDPTATTTTRWAGGVFTHKGSNAWHYVDIGPVGPTLPINPITGLSATGTPSSSTYLRGDGAWAAVAGSSFAPGSVVYPPSGNYFWTPNIYQSGTYNTAGTLFCFPVALGWAITLTELDIQVNTAGDASSVCRVGVYSDNGSLYPGALLLDAGTINCGSTGRKTLTVSQAVPAGVVWLAAVIQNATTVPQLYKMLSGGSATVMGSPMFGSYGANAGFVFANQSQSQTLGYSQASVTGALPANFTTTKTPVDSGIMIVGKA